MIEKNENYWIRKIQFFLHDPVDKVLSIHDHEQRAKKIAEALGETTADKNEVMRADVVAAGLDRASLPGHSKDTSKSGSINFADSSILTHPVNPHHYNLGSLSIKAKDTTQAIIDIIEKDTQDNIWDKKTCFFYLFFILRKRLISENAAGLGFLWDRLPADSRIPDHTIWNHCSMVSALGSCFAESEQNNASLVVFSLTPVQPFIAKTRKLKDHWVASVLLSWLAFEGLSTVINYLGPDHILYPSLKDQPFFELMLQNDKNFNIKSIIEQYNQLLPLQKDRTVASLPNKFVFLAPYGQEEYYVSLIKENINQAWNHLSNLIKQFISKKSGTQLGEAFNQILTRQTENYWNLSWSSTRLLSTLDREDIETLFEKEKFSKVFDTIEAFAKQYSMSNIAYQVTHSVAQTSLAVTKSRPQVFRQEEPGEKCPVCGEFEVLHDIEDAAYKSAEEYKNLRKEFWEKLNLSIGEKTIKSDERLCALCAIKRFAPLAINEFGKDHILNSIFEDHNYPSTTEMALSEFCQKLEQEDLLGDKKELLIDEFHDKEDKDYSREIKDLLNKAKQKGIKPRETDKYYAILLMDGDNMGDLVNGKNINTNWHQVLHPELSKRLKDQDFQKGIWEKFLDEKRLLSPVVHFAISEALGTFALFGLPHIIKQNNGKLVYAGGDDVAAVLPVSNVFDAAIQVNRLYSQGFVNYTYNGMEPIKENNNLETPFTLLLGGSGENTTISGAILICHHKQPLRGAIEETHHLLETVSKEKHIRDALAIKLKKRSGQGRVFASKWNEPNILSNDNYKRLLSFKEIIKAVSNELLSTSLLYRFSELETAALSILDRKNIELNDATKDKILKLFAYEIEHSLYKKWPGKVNKEKRKNEASRLSKHIAGVVLNWNPRAGKKREWEFNAEAPVIASFLSKVGV